MAPHSSTLVWKIPWTEEPGRLQSMGSLRVRHDWATSLLCFTFMHWRRKWQPTPVLFPGESQGRGSLVGCRLWGLTESDMTEVTKPQHAHLLSCVWLFATSWTTAHQQLCPWDFPGKDTRMGYHFLLQGIILPQKSNLGILYLQADSYHWATREPQNIWYNRPNYLS